MVIEGDTLIIISKGDLYAANYLFLDREYCWEYNDSLQSTLELAGKIIEKQDILLKNSDSARYITENNLNLYKQKNSDLNNKVRTNRLLFGSSVLVNILLIVIIAL